MSIAKALSEENRVRILCLLRDGEICVCQIIEVLEIAPSTVSKHLSILQQAQLITSQKKGRWIYYSLLNKDKSSKRALAFNWVFQTLQDEPKIKTDTQKLKKVLQMNPELLCKKQTNRC